MSMNHLALSLVTLLVAVGCLRPAEERAERDLSVGQSTNSAGSVVVLDGLAAVRAHTAQRLVLWQAAPSIDVMISPSTDAPFELELRNSMRRARVTVFQSDATLDFVDGEGTKNLRLRVTPRGDGPIGLRVSPPASDSETFRFALMSDVQEAIDEVQDLYTRINAEPDLDFLLGAGDLTQRGTNRQLLRFENELNGLELPYYTTLGNHELGVSPPLYHDYFGRGSFSFEHRDVRFTLLDTASATVDPLVYEWLDEWLDAGRDKFHILAMHVPPIDPVGVRNGSFASRMEAHKLLQRFLQGRVDLTLYGHVHSFYDFSNADIPAVISGGGGAIPERFDDVGRHFVVFEINTRTGTFSKNLVAIEPH
jgi:predicted phosphodiesterase